jgi:hypothetical protein
MTHLIDQAVDVVAEKLERIDAIGSLRRLIFTLPTCDGDVSPDHFRSVTVKVVLPAEALAELAQLVATDIHGRRPGASVSAIRLAN